MRVPTTRNGGELYSSLKSPVRLRLTVVRNDALPLEAVHTLALNLAVAAALRGQTATVPAAALPAMMRAGADSASLPAGARTREWALPLVHAAPAGEVLLQPRSSFTDARSAVHISIAHCPPPNAAPLAHAAARTATAVTDCAHVALLPVSDEMQLHGAAALVAGAACLRIVLPRTIARRTDRWALVERAVDVAGSALCRTTVPFGRRDRVTLYSPATRAAQAYATLLAELSAP